MKANQILASLSLVVGLTAFADQQADSLLVNFPKNFARQHLGTNLFLFSSATKTYVPTQAAAAWLDDDISTGCPAEPGQQFYLLSLRSPKLLKNLSASFQGASGSLSLYAGDEAAVPGSKSWTALAKDIPVESVNGQLLAKPFARYAKYVLIETNLSTPGTWYSLFLYGVTPSVAYDLHKREQAIDTRSLIGPFVDDETTINLGGLHARSRVFGTEDFQSLQKLIDDNPATSVDLGDGQGERTFFLKFEVNQSVRRIALLTAKPTKGKLEFFVLPEQATESRISEIQTSGYIRAALTQTQAAPTLPIPSVNGLQPTAILSMDGEKTRYSLEMTPVSGRGVVVRWSPESAGQTLPVAEMNVFSGPVTLANYEFLHPQEPARLTTRDGKNFKTSYKTAKELLPSVGEYLPDQDQVATSTSFPGTPSPPSTPPSSDPPLPPPNPSPTPTPTPTPPPPDPVSP